LASPLLGEFVGTFILILLGNGVVAGVLLKRSKGENAGWFAITAGWAFAVLAGVFTAMACGSADAHLNPAVTLSAAVASGDFHKLVPYSLAQLAGAFLGAVVVWVHYGPHWALTTDKDRFSSAASSGGSACHSAARRGMRSIRRAIWVRVSRTRCCRFRESAIRIGAMRSFPSWVL